MQRIYIRNETLTTRGEARLPTRRRRLANRLAQLTLEAIGERLGSTLINETKRNETLYASTFDSGPWREGGREGVCTTVRSAKKRRHLSSLNRNYPRPGYLTVFRLSRRVRYKTGDEDSVQPSFAMLCIVAPATSVVADREGPKDPLRLHLFIKTG